MRYGFCCTVYFLEASQLVPEFSLSLKSQKRKFENHYRIKVDFLLTVYKLCVIINFV